MRNTTVLMALVLLLTPGCESRSVWSSGDGGSNNSNSNVTTGCAEPGDCLAAVWADQCCGCPVPATRSQVEAEACLVSVYQSFIPPECEVYCDDVDCPPCVHWDDPVTCAGDQCVWNEGGCNGDDDCLLVIQVNDCCTQAFPMSLNDIFSDPCLVFWPPTDEISPTCRAQWDADCDLLNCTWSPPDTRNAVCSATGCDLAPECANAQDCTLALSGRECCPCPRAWPATMIGRDPCLVLAGTPIPPDCPTHDCLMDCGPCPPEARADCAASVCTTNYP